jgi:hypothetical protein
MKNFILSLALIAGSVISAQTAQKSPRSITFGVKAGLNLSSLDGDYISSNPKAGINGGIFGNIPISSKFSIQPEILYSGLFNNYNTHRVENNNLIIDETKQSQHYLSLPVFLQYSRGSRFFVEVGTQASVLIHSKYEYKSESIDNTKDLRSIDFGLGIGAGYYFMPSLGVTLRYVGGITKIKSDGPRNNVVQIGLAYKL